MRRRRNAWSHKCGRMPLVIALSGLLLNLLPALHRSRKDRSRPALSPQGRRNLPRYRDRRHRSRIRAASADTNDPQSWPRRLNAEVIHVQASNANFSRSMFSFQSSPDPDDDRVMAEAMRQMGRVVSTDTSSAGFTGVYLESVVRSWIAGRCGSGHRAVLVAEGDNGTNRFLTFFGGDSQTTLPATALGLCSAYGHDDLTGTFEKVAPDIARFLKIQPTQRSNSMQRKELSALLQSRPDLLPTLAENLRQSSMPDKTRRMLRGCFALMKRTLALFQSCGLPHLSDDSFYRLAVTVEDLESVRTQDRYDRLSRGFSAGKYRGAVRFPYSTVSSWNWRPRLGQPARTRRCCRRSYRREFLWVFFWACTRLVRQLLSFKSLASIAKLSQIFVDGIGAVPNRRLVAAALRTADLAGADRRRGQRDRQHLRRVRREKCSR